MTVLERAARAVWDEIARQNGENTSGYAGTYAGRPDYVEGFIDSVALVRAVLMAVRDPGDAACAAGAPFMVDEDTSYSLGEWSAQKVFTAMIDAILNEKDTTND